MTQPNDEFDFDVFISYSSKDKKWVRGELLKRIERAGLKAFIDYRDFTRGAPSIKECERGVVKCRKTLIVLTPDYIESEWCEFEAIMAQTLSPANRKLRLIPLLKKKCKKPLRIGMLTHIDFTGDADLDLAWGQLLTALGAPPAPVPPKQPKRDDWFLAHPYPMPPHFTGRVAQRDMLTGWLTADAAHPLLVLRALGGFGKSALAWHWLLNDVAPAACPRVVWWSFYEGDASFDNFLAKTLYYLSGGKIKLTKPSTDDLTTLQQMLHQPGTLLVLDGFERVLRAFGGLDAAYQGDEVKPEDRSAKGKGNDRDCISPLAELFLRGAATLPNLRSKVLLTTRLSPRVLEAKGGGYLQGCREEELRQMQPADAVAFFVARGIRGTHAEIEAACDPYGYHPLSLCLLAGLIVGDFQQPGDIAAARRLDVSGDQVQRKHHVLEVAYDSLTSDRQALLGRIACFRGPVKYLALKALAETTEESVAALDADLHDLVARGLLHHDSKQARFDLHAIVRRYAYDRLAAPDRAAAHAHLRDYFAAVPPPDKVTRLDDLAPVIELYHHTVRAGQFDEACELLSERLVPHPLHFQFGAYQLMIELKRALFPDGEHSPPRLKKESNQAWTLNALASSYVMSGQPRRGVPLLEQHNAICEKQGNKENLAVGLPNLAQTQLVIGTLQAAEGNLRRSIGLCREINNEYREAVGHQELGRLLAYRGAYAKSETELRTSTGCWKKISDVQGQCVDEAYRARRGLLLLRSNLDSAPRAPQSALESARRALELADEWQKQVGRPNARDYVRTHWLLGAAHRVASQTGDAESHLNEALQRCRHINLVEMEAGILIDLARLRAATGAADEARRLAEEALLITERCGYVLQGADARLELAKLALAGGDKNAAKDHAKQARKLATCDGPPDYTYKAAYDEAAALLTELTGSARRAATPDPRGIPARGSIIAAETTRKRAPKRPKKAAKKRTKKKK